MFHNKLNPILIESILKKSSNNVCKRMKYVNKWRADDTERTSRTFGKLYKIKYKPVKHETPTVCKGAPEFLIKFADVNIPLRRQAKLNQVLTEQITEILSTETFGFDLHNHGIQITQIEVSSAYNYCSIYWTSTDPEADIHLISQKLNIVANPLRKYLIENQIMPRAPIVKFLYDKLTSHLNIVSSQLKKADFGPDFEPADPTTFRPPGFYKPEEEVPGTKPNVFKKHLIRLDVCFDPPKEESPPNDEIKFQCPDDMTQDILGLNYEIMINKVIFQMQKTGLKRMIEKPLPPSDWLATPIANPVPIDNETLTTSERVTAMKKFVVSHKKKRMKMSREFRRHENERLDVLSDELNQVKDRSIVNDHFEDMTDNQPH